MMVVLGLMVKFKITSKWIRRFVYRLYTGLTTFSTTIILLVVGHLMETTNNAEKKLALLVREISWTKNIVIIERCKEREKTGDVREILIFSWLDETEVMEESNLLWRGVGK